MQAPAALVTLDEVRHSPDWKRWSELAADAPPFLSPEFFALVTPLAETGTPLVAQAWQPDRMLGALPLVLVGDTLRALRTDHSPEYDYCGAADGIDAIWDVLRDDARWNELVLDKVPKDSVLAIRLPALARHDGCPALVRPDTAHPYLALPRFEAAMNGKFRTNVQRCARKAGDLVLERILVPTRADLDEATAIEAMAWKGAAGTHIAADPRVEHVYHALGRLLGRRGRAALYFLRIAGKRVATLFALEDRHTLFALKIGYDPAYANLSPGHLMIWKVAADAEQRGLLELDFVGRQDEWKRKWTEKTHEHVSIVIYRRSARGLVRYGLREVLKPRLPETVRTTPRSPLPRRCQHADVLGEHTLLARARGRLDQGLGIKSGLRRLLARTPERARLGRPSRFPVGSWVHVLDDDSVHATLDDSGRLRGLAFVPTQWATCRGLYRVAHHVRRIRDDHGRFRAVSGTVLLEGVDCAGHGPEVERSQRTLASEIAPAGCGRHCPLMYRDEWLAPAQPPRSEPHPQAKVRHARVRDLEEITAGLDLFGRRDGLTFMPEMAAYAGRRLPIAGSLPRVFELDRWIPPRRAIYLLGGVQCSGKITGERGPCDRACALMWHEDWLIVEDV